MLAVEESFCALSALSKQQQYIIAYSVQKHVATTYVAVKYFVLIVVA